MIKDSSVSRFDDREFKLVEPNKVIVGSDEGDGRTHIPSDECETILASVIDWGQPLA
jgi:hypothetical protein